MSNPCRRERTISIVEIIVNIAEVVIAALLVVLLFYSIWAFVIQMFTTFSRNLLSVEAIRLLIDKVLLLFLIIELYKISIAYLKMESVVNEVFVATFLALGRKILIYDYEKWGLQGAIALSLLMLALSAGYFLLALRRTNGEVKK